MTSVSLQFQILLPARINKNNKTLIDKVFCNIPEPGIKTAIIGNISWGILDHLRQFPILPEFFSNTPELKYNISSDIIWQLLYNCQQLNSYTCYNKKFKKQERKFKRKTWISRGNKNSIKRKKAFKKLIKCKNPKMKSAVHSNSKIYRNELSILLKESKKLLQ